MVKVGEAASLLVRAGAMDSAYTHTHTHTHFNSIFRSINMSTNWLVHFPDEQGEGLGTSLIHRTCRHVRDEKSSDISVKINTELCSAEAIRSRLR